VPEFQFDSLADFLAMGGDAAFVWASYAVFALFILWNLWQPRIERRRVMRLVRARRIREQSLAESVNRTDETRGGV
jgi:heme exporter protein D